MAEKTDLPLPSAMLREAILPCLEEDSPLVIPTLDSDGDKGLMMYSTNRVHNFGGCVYPPPNKNQIVTTMRLRSLKEQEWELREKHEQERARLKEMQQRSTLELKQKQKHQTLSLVSEQISQTKQLLRNQQAEIDELEWRRVQEETDLLCQALSLEVNNRVKQGSGCRGYHVDEEGHHYVTFWQNVDDPKVYNWALIVHNNNNTKNVFNQYLFAFRLECLESQGTSFYPFVRFRLAKLI